MWDFIKKAGQQVLQAGITYAENRAFITSLFQGTQEEAIRRLRERVRALDDNGYTSFKVTLSGMIGEATQHLQQVQASGGLGAWGNSFEDRMAQAVAEIQTGDRSSSSGAIRQAEQILGGLQAVMQYAEAFRAEMLYTPQASAALASTMQGTEPVAARAAASGAGSPNSPRPAVAPTAKMQENEPDGPDVAEIERLLDQMAETGKTPDGLFEKLTQLRDPDAMERLVEKMKALGGEELGTRPLLIIKDYYVERTEMYSLLWPLSPELQLPIAFEELNRETQFHVLWGELSRRLAEGSMLRNAGKIDAAESVFRECIERADQLDVPLLKAQGYEGLMTVAERRGDRAAAARYLKLVEQEQDRQSARDAERGK